MPSPCADSSAFRIPVSAILKMFIMVVIRLDVREGGVDFFGNKKPLFATGALTSLRCYLFITVQQVQHAKLGTPVGVQLHIQVQACCEFVVVVRSELLISITDYSTPAAEFKANSSIGNS